MGNFFISRRNDLLQRHFYALSDIPRHVNFGLGALCGKESGTKVALCQKLARNNSTFRSRNSGSEDYNLVPPRISVFVNKSREVFCLDIIQRAKIFLESQMGKREKAWPFFRQQSAPITDLFHKPLRILGRAPKIGQHAFEVLDDLSTRNLGEVLTMNLTGYSHKEPALGSRIKKADSGTFFELGLVPFIKKGICTLFIQSYTMLRNGSSQKTMHYTKNRNK